MTAQADQARGVNGHRGHDARSGGGYSKVFAVGVPPGPTLPRPLGLVLGETLGLYRAF